MPFDLAKANAPNQAGYRWVNGIRIANGHLMSYTVIFASDQSGPGDRAFQIIQAVAESGFILTSGPVPPPQPSPWTRAVGEERELNGG